MSLPRDTNGFIKMFSPYRDSESEIIKFFDKYGLVVIKGVLDKKEILESIDAI